MATQPFIWGANGEQLSPDQVASMRRVAEAIASRGGAPQNLGEGLNRVGEAFLHNANVGRAGEAESAGQKLVADALAAKDWQGVVANEWASPGQARVGSAMMDRGWQLEDRAANWAREDARAAAVAAKANWETMESGGDIYRYNANDPNSRPELFFDGPDAIPDAPKIEETFDPVTGQPVKKQWVGGEWQDFGGVGAPKAPLVTVNNGGADDEFYKAGAKLRGEQFAKLEASGLEAQTKIGQINRLETLLSTSPQGFEGVAKQALGELGIPTDGLDSIQSAQALINKMVPQQRPAGSGTMSDADLALFKASLPRIVNQEGGNELIMQTLKGVAVYEQALGDIATKVLNKEISPADGQAQMKAVPNPLELFRSLDESSASDAGNPPDGVDAATWGALTPEERALWD